MNYQDLESLHFEVDHDFPRYAERQPSNLDITKSAIPYL